MYNCITEFIKPVGEKDKICGFAEHHTSSPPMGLINSIIQEHECKILFII